MNLKAYDSIILHTIKAVVAIVTMLGMCFSIIQHAHMLISLFQY